MAGEPQTFCEVLEHLIRTADHQIYGSSGHQLGWRFLYGPKATLDSSSCLLIGLNPGGKCRQTGDGLSVEAGSAYQLERWNRQHRSRAIKIIDAMGYKQREHEVLVGNLVPFRSSKWPLLPRRDQALKHGLDLWKLVLDYCAPKLRLVVAHGELPRFAAIHLLDVRIDTGPTEREVIEGGFANGCRFVGIPHLSRRSDFDIKAVADTVERNAKRARRSGRLR